LPSATYGDVANSAMKAVTEAIKPVLIRFLKSEAVRQLVVDLLKAYSKTTDNSIDDGIVDLVSNSLGLNK